MSYKTSSPVDQIRNNLRQYQKSLRELKRDYERDFLRIGLGEVDATLHNMTPAEINKIAKKIKRNKHASKNDMFMLNNGFLQKEENIETFLNIPGAIDIIVKEFTGHEANLQQQACEVLLNLSLGSSQYCAKLTTVTGSYLITFLDSTDTNLQLTSIWTITNIISTGGKGLKILYSQRVLQKLYSFLKQDLEDLHRGALIALNTLLIHEKELITDEDILYLKGEILSTNVRLGDHLKLIFKIVFRTEIRLSLKEQQFICKSCLLFLSEQPGMSTYEERTRIIYSMRNLANLFVLNPLIFQFFKNECSIEDFYSIVNHLIFLNCKAIVKEVFWLLGNIERETECEYSFKFVLKNVRIHRFHNFD